MKQSIIILLIAIFATFGLASYKLFLRFTHPIKYQTLIIETCEKYHLKPNIVASLINVESSYNSKAKSNKNAIGLMQIKLTTANYVANLNNKEILTEHELFEPQINIEYGCMYLQYLSKKFSNIYTVLAAYNAGETKVRLWLKDLQYSQDQITLNYIPFEETENYIKKIKNNLNFYSLIYK